MRSGSRTDSFFRVETAGVTESMSCQSACRLYRLGSSELTLLKMEVNARGRRQSTNSRLISGVKRHAAGVRQVGSCSDVHRSTKLCARWERKAVRKADQWPELLGWKNYMSVMDR